MIKLVRNIIFIITMLYVSKPIQPESMQRYISNITSVVTKAITENIDSKSLKDIISLIEKTVRSNINNKTDI